MTVDTATLTAELARLVQIPSVNPDHAGPEAGPPGEAAMADEVAERLERLGASVTIDEVAPGRPNVYGLVPGRTARTIALDVHLDTVGVEHMTVPPFDGRIEDGRVYGRGSVDTKASLAVMISVLDELKRQGRRPESAVLVVGTVSEEAGGLKGAVAFREWAERTGVDVAQLMVAEPTNCAPVFGHKGGCGFEVVVHGHAAHSSTPHLGTNAIAAAARIVTAMEDEHHSLQDGESSTEVGLGTLTVSMISGGRARNIVPDRCEIAVGRRIVPHEDPYAEFARLTEIARAAAEPCTIDVELINGVASPAFYQSPDSAFARQLAGWSGNPPTTVPYGSNALRYLELADEMIVLGPGSIDQAHQAIEWVEISELEKLAAIYERWLCEPVDVAI